MSNFARPAPNWQHRPTTLFMLARYADRDQIVVDTTYQRPFGYWDDGGRSFTSTAPAGRNLKTTWRWYLTLSPKRDIIRV